MVGQKLLLSLSGTAMAIGLTGFTGYLANRYIFSGNPLPDIVVLFSVGIFLAGFRINTIIGGHNELDLDDALVMFLIAGYMLSIGEGLESKLLASVFVLEILFSQARKYRMKHIK